MYLKAIRRAFYEPDQMSYIALPVGHPLLVPPRTGRYIER